MSATCQPLPQSVIRDFLQDAVRALCDRPGDTPAQKEGRAHRLVHTTLGFQPRDGLEYMLATLAQGHYDLILDSMRDAFQGQIDTVKAKTISGVVGLGRAFRGLLADQRRAAARPLTEEAQREEDARRAGEARRAAAAEAPASAASPASVAPAPMPQEVARAAGTPPAARPVPASPGTAPRSAAPHPAARPMEAGAEAPPVPANPGTVTFARPVPAASDAAACWRRSPGQAGG